MKLSRKAISILFDSVKENIGKAYRSLVEEKLKGNVIYKIYFEMTCPNKYSEKPEYGKLVFSTKNEVIISPLNELEKAVKKSKAVNLTRFEFEKKTHTPRYLYIFKVGDYYFDLPEELANKLAVQEDLKIHFYP